MGITTRTLTITLALATVLLAAASVSAQTCGDADGNGNVTVSDGVQALRAAASLSSSCDASCDLDGGGTVTISDGVNILRKAAGLSVNSACDFTSQDTNDVVTPSLSIFDGITKVPGIGSAGALAAGTPDCDNTDGSVEITEVPNGGVATFDNCRIAGTILDGTISRATLAQGVLLGFDGFKTTHVKNGKSLTFNGTLGVESLQVGRRITGKINVDSSEQGAFTLEFQRILLIAGSPRQGSLIYDLTKSDSDRIARIKIDFSDADELPVTVELRNGQIRHFTLDRATRIVGFPG